MNYIKKINALFSLILINIVLTSCSNSLIRPNKELRKFTFNELNLKQNHANGEPAWIFTSPQANYDIQLSVVLAEDPIGYLFKNQSREYKITGDKLNLYEGGELLELKGNVQILKLTNNSFSIKGSHMKWDTKGSKISFHGKTELYLFDSLNTTNNLNPFYSIEATDAVWDPESGYFYASGPVFAKRSNNSNLNQNIINANAIEGSTAKHYLDLLDCNYKKSTSIKSKAKRCQLIFRRNNSVIQSQETNSIDKSISKIYLTSDDSYVDTVISFPLNK